MKKNVIFSFIIAIVLIFFIFTDGTNSDNDEIIQNITSFFYYLPTATQKNIDEDILWFSEREVARNPFAANIYMAGDSQQQEILNKFKYMATKNKEVNLYYGIGFQHGCGDFPWNQINESAENMVSQLKLLLDNGVFPCIDNWIIIYIDAEFDLYWALTDRWFQKTILDFYAAVINRLHAELPKNMKMIIVWSPFLGVINLNPVTLEKEHKMFLEKLALKINLIRLNNLYLVVSLQDGVGKDRHRCQNIDIWGDRNPYSGIENYQKNLRLLEAFYASKPLRYKDKIFLRVNAELFDYDCNNVEPYFYFADIGRIDRQITDEWLYSDYGLGPSWIFNDRSMGPEYSNKYFKQKY